MDKDNEDVFVDAIGTLARAVSKDGVKCEDLRYVSETIEGLRDAICRVALPASVHDIEFQHDGKVGDLTEAVCAVAFALFAIAHAIDSVSTSIDYLESTHATDA